MTLEFLDEGERLVLLIDDGEPYENVPESLELEGHKLVSIERAGAGWRLLVERGEE
jgi:TusA-related sulfurtransferase